MDDADDIAEAATAKILAILGDAARTARIRFQQELTAPEKAVLDARGMPQMPAEAELEAFFARALAGEYNQPGHA